MLKNVQKRMTSGKYLTNDFSRGYGLAPEEGMPRAFLLLPRPFPQGYPAGRPSAAAKNMAFQLACIS